MPQFDHDSTNHPDRSARSTSLTTAAAVLPMAIAGGCLGLLLLYLNPDAGLSMIALLRFLGGYMLVGSAAGMVLALPFVWRNPARASAFFPWATTTVLMAAALYYLLHASRWSYYLPSVANRRLLTAAVVLVVPGLIAFYTALLHTLHQRPYSYRSLGLVAACGVGALIAVAALHPPTEHPESSPVSRVLERRSARPIVVVGLDGATLEVLLPLAEQGALPTIGSWISEGTVAPVATLKPPREAALWTSVATGTWPYHHRIEGERVHSTPWGGAGELRLLPEWIGFESWGLPSGSSRPVTATDLQRKPLWQVYRDFGLEVEVLGWPTVGGPVSTAALTSLRSNTDAIVVRLGDLVAVSKRSFGAWLRVREGAHDGELEHPAAQFEDAWRRLDSALAAWQATLPPDRVVALVAPYGYGPLPRWREIVSRLSGQEPGGGTARGGRAGVLILHGPGIRRQERLPAVRMVDVMPTLMHAAGLPVAADLDGDVVTRAFAPEGLADQPLTFVPSYENQGRSLPGR